MAKEQQIKQWENTNKIRNARNAEQFPHFFYWVSVGCARSQAYITLCIVRYFSCAHLTYLFMPTKIQLIKTLRLIRPNLISTTSFGMCVTVNFKRNYFFNYQFEKGKKFTFWQLTPWLLLRHELSISTRCPNSFLK